MNPLRRQIFSGLVLATALAVTACASAGPVEDFFIAIKRDNAGAVESMLKAGVDPNAKNARGDAALVLAIQEPSPRSLKVLMAWPGTKAEVRNSHDESPLMMAALKGQVDLVKALIARDGDVNKPGWAPLHYAVSSSAPEQMEIVRILLDADAYIDAESPNKTTPLMMAARYGNEQSVKLLYDAGADPTVRNDKGLTAADFARLAERADLAAQLDQVASRYRKPAASAAPAIPAAPSSPPAKKGW